MTPFFGSVILLLFFSFTPSVYAQEDIPYIQSLTIEDGLSSTQVTKYLLDSRGFMWFGTSYGLNCYDGTSIKYYTEDHGLAHHYILNIIEDNVGNLLINSGGFDQRNLYWSVLNPITEEIIPLDDYVTESETSLPEKFDCFKSTYDGSVLLTEMLETEHIIYRLKDQGLEQLLSINREKNSGRIEVPNQISKHEISYIYREYVGNTYSSILYTHNLETGETKESPIDLGSYFNYRNGDDKMYYMAFNEALDEVKIYVDNSYYGSFNLDGRKINFVNISDDLIVLTSLYSKYMEVFDFATQESLIKTNLADNIEFTRDVVQLDDQNGLWFCGPENINRLHFKKKYFSTPNISDDSGLDFTMAIRGIISTPDSKVMVTNSVGLTELDKDTIKYAFYYRENLEFRNGLGFLLLDSVLIIGSELATIIEYDLLTQKTTSSELPNFPVLMFWQPFQDSNGKVWLGSSRGLYHYNFATKEIQSIPEDENYPEFSKSSIYHFLETDAGTWISTSTGFYLFDVNQSKVLAQYNKDKTSKFFLPCKHIAHSYQDADGIFWLASKGQGLTKWDPTTGDYSNYTTLKSGLSHNVIYAVYEDDFNNLWLPSNYGLMCFNKITENVTVYLKEDGLPNNEFNTISHHKDAAGNLYFGTIDGLVYLNPADFNHTSNQYPFLLSSSYAINKSTEERSNITTEVLDHQEIRLKPSDKAIEMNFALINFDKMQGTQYSYKIEGLHDQWIYLENGQLRISEMQYGDYNILVRAKPAGSANWTDYDVPISLKVVKPFYLTWWFILLLLSIIATSIFYFFRRSTRVLKQRQVELEHIVNERTEEIRLQAEELKVLDKVKSNFFANISHELRTPLTLILGPLSFILDSPEKMDEPDVQKQLHVMQRNGKNLMHLIEEILDLSKLEANKLELNEVSTNVKEFFEYIFFVFEPQFENSQLVVNFQSNVDPKLHVLMDRKKMEKVLNNFLSNAIKFSRKGDQITVGVSLENEQIKMVVKDTGKGIHENDLPYIFDRFYQSKQADQKLYGGTGIGLALVKEYAHLMNGDVYAESTIGVGSSFHFHFPAKIVANKNISLVDEMPSAAIGVDEDVVNLEGQQFTILVVEDNMDMRSFIHQLLASKYDTVLTAQNGAEALEIIEEQGTNIHLVVSDVMMPEVDGLTLVKKVKSSAEWFTIPFIMLTALAAERDKLAALTIGVDDYLTKPFSVPELLARVQNLLTNYYLRKQWWKVQEKAPLELPVSDPVLKTTINVSENEQAKAFAEELRSYIEEHLEDGKIDVDSLAKAFHVSQRQLNRKLKTCTGLSPAKFIKEVQLQTARKLLEDGNFFSISEVAYNVGFEQANTFSTLFKKRFGKTPSDYTKSTQAVSN